MYPLGLAKGQEGSPWVGGGAETCLLAENSSKLPWADPALFKEQSDLAKSAPAALMLGFWIVATGGTTSRFLHLSFYVIFMYLFCCGCGEGRSATDFPDLGLQKP